MMKEIMIKAHKIAKTLEGDYSARLSMALKLVWEEVKTQKKALIIRETTKAKLLTLICEDILGNERKITSWFPNGWLNLNNIPKDWALNKKEMEIRALHPGWDLSIVRVVTI